MNQSMLRRLSFISLPFTAVTLFIRSLPTLKIVSSNVFIFAVIMISTFTLRSTLVNGQIVFGVNNDDETDLNSFPGVQIINPAASTSSTGDLLLMIVSGDGNNQQFLMILPPSLTPRNSRRTVRPQVIRL